VFATDPTPYSKEASYGVDLVAVPRARVLSLGGSGDLIDVRIAADVPTALWLSVDPELAGEIRSVLGSMLSSAG
jgi:hypothetical protein